MASLAPTAAQIQHCRIGRKTGVATIANIVVTGASGLIGSALIPALTTAGHQCLGLTRQAHPDLQQVDYQHRAKLVSLMAGQNCLVHLAGVAHNPKATAKDFQAGNVDLTKTLIKAAKDSGIRHFVMVSSIKAMGEVTNPGQPLTHETICSPEDDYGRSKLEAEQALQKLCNQLNINWTIIRPPLVYAPNADGNIAKLRKALEKGWPLPFDGINNQRDIVSLPILNNLINHCIENKSAFSGIFLVSNGKPISTAELVRAIAKDCGRQPNLKMAPPFVIKAAKCMPIARDYYRKLAGDLTIDIQHTCDTLNWSPTNP